MEQKREYQKQTKKTVKVQTGQFNKDIPNNCKSFETNKKQSKFLNRNH